jgi:hypothetical protein
MSSKSSDKVITASELHLLDGKGVERMVLMADDAPYGATIRLRGPDGKDRMILYAMKDDTQITLFRAGEGKVAAQLGVNGRGNPELSMPPSTGLNDCVRLLVHKGPDGVERGELELNDENGKPVKSK